MKQVFARFGKRFWCLPSCWYRNETTFSPSFEEPDGAQPGVVRSRSRSNGFFPFWHYSCDTWDPVGTQRKTGSILLKLYDYKKEARPSKEGDMESYSRSRILWRVWHCERSLDTVSVDVFPAITYDQRGSEFKKVSFLWRCFRYERSPEGTALDLFFVPLVRPKD